MLEEVWHVSKYSDKLSGATFRLNLLHGICWNQRPVEKKNKENKMKEKYLLRNP